MAKSTGIEERHLKRCASHRSRRCNCERRYRGFVWNTRRDAPDYGPWTTSKAEATSWRAKAHLERRSRRARAKETSTLRVAVESFLHQARAGSITDRTGKRYKPSTLRGYERDWRLHIESDGLGPHKLSDISRADLQALADRLGEQGLAGSTIRNIMNPLRVVYRRAVQRGQLDDNPTLQLHLPAATGSRERFATREEAAALIAALPEKERALWAAAFYAGLRRGELRALRWSDVDLDAGLIQVRKTWDDDPEVGAVDPKTSGAKRRLPIVANLKPLLELQQRLTERKESALVFGAADHPFAPTTVRHRAQKAWKAADLEPIGLHECRHTFASLMIAAGCNAKALSVMMGHASIQITFDRYGKLMPGSEAEVGAALDVYLAGGPN